MFTHLIEIFLVIGVSSTVFFATTIWLQDRREARELDREFAAKLFADSTIMDDIMAGKYNRATLTDLHNDREFLKITYLNQ